MILSRRRQAFNGHNLGAVRLCGQHDAGPHRFAIDEDGADATYAVLTSSMRARQIQVVAQEIGQQRAGLAMSHMIFAIHLEMYLD
jgi:hypothetical protein